MHGCTHTEKKSALSVRDAAESGRGCVTQSGCVALFASSLRFDIHPVSDGGYIPKLRGPLLRFRERRRNTTLPGEVFFLAISHNLAKLCLGPVIIPCGLLRLQEGELISSYALCLLSSKQRAINNNCEAEN